MAGGVSKGEGALLKGAQAVDTAFNDIQGQLGNLRGKLAGIQAQWQGGGSSAFQGTMTRWDESAKKITTALQDFEANLRGSEDTYNTNDSNVASTMANFDSRF